MSNPFDNSPTAVATEAPVEEVETSIEEPDADVDVDAGTETDEEEVVAEAPPASGKHVVKKTAASKTVNARKPVADGYIAPVEAAKKLSEHLTAKARAAGEIKDDEEIEVRPQVVYSTLKNNGEKSKNPIPQYTDPALTGGRQCVLKLDEFLAWWDNKDKRVAERKTAAKVKSSKATATEPVTEAEADAPPAVEAE